MYKLARIVFTLYCYIFNRFKVFGRENVPEDGPLILFANHQSMFDVFPLNIAIKRQIFFMAKSSLFKVPIVGWAVRKYGAFPVDRDKPDFSAIKNSFKTLRNGHILGIFPEGTRVRNGLTKDGMKPTIKSGFLMIAQKSKAPLLPVKICYKRMFFLFNSIKVYIGKPFTLEEKFGKELSNEELEIVGEELVQNLQNLDNT